MSLAQRVEELHALESQHAATIRSIQEDLQAIADTHSAALKKMNDEQMKRSQKVLSSSEVALTKQRALWQKLEHDIGLLRTHLAAATEEKRSVVEAHARRRAPKEDHCAKALSAAKGTYLRQERTKREAWMGTETVHIQQNARKAAEPEIAALLHQQREELRRRREEREVDLAEMYRAREHNVEREEAEVRSHWAEQTLRLVELARKETQQRLDETSRRVMEGPMETATQTHHVKRRVREEFWGHERAMVQQDRDAVREQRAILGRELLSAPPAPALLLPTEPLEDLLEDNLESKIARLRDQHRAALEVQKGEQQRESQAKRDEELKGLVGHFEAAGMDVMSALQSERRLATSTARRAQAQVDEVRNRMITMRGQDTSLAAEERDLTARLAEDKKVLVNLEESFRFEREELRRHWMATVRETEAKGQRALQLTQESLAQRQPSPHLNVSDVDIERQHAAEIGDLEIAHEAQIVELKSRVTSQCSALQATVECLLAEKASWEQRAAVAEAELRALESVT